MPLHTHTRLKSASIAGAIMLGLAALLTPGLVQTEHNIKPVATTVSEPSASQFQEADSGQQIETAIARAQSQIGVPYAWGGGGSEGPTLGLADGGTSDANGDFAKVGFDCSGLTQYAFAGAGIHLPQYTGHQYDRGTKIDPSDMQRGDLIFYGAGGGSHVAIYLGDGMMIEAPASGSVVQENPVRWSGMSEYAVRLV